MRFFPRLHAPLGGAAALLALAAGPISAQSAPATDARATVAVTEFTNGALGRTEEFAALSAGIQEIAITTLAASPAVRVVERRRLQEILAEQKLQAGDGFDQSTAVRVGQILGAQHFVTGGIVIFRGDVRIDVRVFNTETSRVEYTETMQGRENELLELIDRISRKLASNLKLPSLPQQQASSKPPKADQAKAIALLGRALIARDRGDKQAMVAAANEALAIYPGFAPARALVDGASPPPKPETQE
jgi:TolB-like protein